MLHWLSLGLLATLLNTPEARPMLAVNWASWGEDATWTAVIEEPTLVDDPVAIAAVQQHLQRLTALGMPASAQGVWLQSGREILAEHRGTTPIPAASLTKIPTTLAALETWGIDHQFETLVGFQGTVQPGVLTGDLVIEGRGDPLFVWEEAIALGAALNQLGITQVTGDLIITGDFAMNFEANPQRSGELLRQGMNANLWNAEAATQYNTMVNRPAQPVVQIQGNVVYSDRTPSYTPLLQHRSLSLTQILKAMNIFSNNFIADWLATRMGGGPSVATKAAAAARLSPNEIQLINGSGLGEANQISPRAVTAMLLTLQSRFKASELTVADFFPVVGRERGTLGRRSIVPGAAFKTGTLDRVSSLAGVVPTRDRGLVWFAIFDIGTGELATLHAEQDRLLQTLVGQWGQVDALPREILPSDRLKSYAEELGDPKRIQLLQPVPPPIQQEAP
ncbi:D-alanyl-D-alanine carboxypeptidase [Leptolyngbya sp. AN02str]|uniref:D-alanyl-D-alanine carboxypeptidase n=1 Tax=Leptolyngbya sp. AN02str TaxID=3423363 RepID=UPI003D315E03